MRDARKISGCITLPAAHNVFLFKDEIASSANNNGGLAMTAIYDKRKIS